MVYADNGNLYISEFSGDSVTRCFPDGSGLIRFGESGIGDGQFKGPGYIALDNRGYLYITDYSIPYYHNFGKTVVSHD